MLIVHGFSAQFARLSLLNNRFEIDLKVSTEWCESALILRAGFTGHQGQVERLIRPKFHFADSDASDGDLPSLSSGLLGKSDARRANRVCFQDE